MFSELEALEAHETYKFYFEVIHEKRIKGSPVSYTCGCGHFQILCTLAMVMAESGSGLAKSRIQGIYCWWWAFEKIKLMIKCGLNEGR